jgi:hypothetical protein
MVVGEKGEEAPLGQRCPPWETEGRGRGIAGAETGSYIKEAGGNLRDESRIQGTEFRSQNGMRDLAEVPSALAKRSSVYMEILFTPRSTKPTVVS